MATLSSPIQNARDGLVIAPRLVTVLGILTSQLVGTVYVGMLE